MSEIIVLGACVTDLFSYTTRFPLPGETLVADSFMVGFGGKGANTAYMCSLLGVKTALLAKLGDDNFGDTYRKYLETAGICAKYVSTEKNCPSAASGITVTSTGENTIVYFAGSADRLTPEDIDKAEDAFRHAKVFASVFETSLENVIRGLELAHKHGVTTYINAAPVSQKAFPPEALPLIDYLCVNETEGSALVCGILKVPIRQMPDQEICDELLKRGVKHIIMTKGSKGAVFSSQGSLKLKIVTGVKVDNVVDTTGAGDSFNGSFVYHLLRNAERPLEERIKRACGIASMSVTKKGTQSSYPSRKDVPQEFL